MSSNTPAQSFDISLDLDNPALLAESPLLRSASYSHTGHGGDDLSLSELSLADRTPTFDQPFTLFPHSSRSSTPQRQPEVALDEQFIDENPSDDAPRDSDDEDGDVAQKHTLRIREEKLQRDIFVLKKLNSSFATFHGALRDTGSANERVAAQLEQTDALLDKYISILSRSETYAQLIFDEKWQGGEVDEEVFLERNRIAREKARREAEEQAQALLREQQRLEREERERLEREEKQRIERERKERGHSRGTVRGVRGTRASMRGVQPSTRAASAGAGPSSRPLQNPPSSSGVSKRPSSSAGRASSTTARGTSRR